MTSLAALSIILFAPLLSSACSALSPAPKVTPTPMPTQIVTSIGTLTVEQVQLSDRFPPDCSASSPMCQQAAPGYQVLVVWLGSKGSASDIGGKLLDASNEVYVVDSNGSRTDRAIGGLIQGRLMVAFTPPVSAHSFHLYWPGNPAIDLGK